MNAYVKLILVAPYILELIGTIMLANSLKIVRGSPDVVRTMVRELAVYVDFNRIAIIERRSARLWWGGVEFPHRRILCAGCSNISRLEVAARLGFCPDSRSFFKNGWTWILPPLDKAILMFPAISTAYGFPSVGLGVGPGLLKN